MEQDKIWDVIQKNPERATSGCNDSGRLDAVAKTIGQGSVLNIGVGSGKLESLLLAKGNTVSSVDPSDDTITLINTRGVDGKVGRIEKLPFPTGTFDWVVVSEVLEHLDDQTLKLGLAEIHRVLKVEGAMVGTVPADEILNKSLCICPTCATEFHRWGHVQSFNEQYLSRVIGVNFDRFSIRRVHFFDRKQLSTIGLLSSLLKYFLARIGRRGANQNFFFISYK